MYNLTPNISVIVFSKDRPLQLQGYLESLLHFTKVDQSLITVLYKYTSKIDYQRLIKEFPQVRWIKEGLFFDDLLNAVDKSNEYIMFGCDDVVFKDHIDFPFALSLLKSDENVFGFSTRLGENIHPLPTEIQKFDTHLQWDWKSTNAPNWNYPWELDATIYRKTDIINIISKFDIQAINPNFFEGEVSKCPEKYIDRKELACFRKGKCIVLTINRVQDDFLNDYDSTIAGDIETLYNLYQDDVKIDFISISKTKNHSIHVGAEFLKLQKNNKNYRPIKLYLPIYRKGLITFLKNAIKYIIGRRWHKQDRGI